MKRSAWRYLWKSQDIRRKLLITFALLVIYRLASNVPVPGIDENLVAQLTTSSGAAGGSEGPDRQLARPERALRASWTRRLQ